MNNYYLDLVDSQFKKCNEKCKECNFGVDFCSECSDGYYKIEDQEYNCSKFKLLKIMYLIQINGENVMKDAKIALDRQDQK